MVEGSILMTWLEDGDVCGREKEGSNEDSKEERDVRWCDSSQPLKTACRRLGDGESVAFAVESMIWVETSVLPVAVVAGTQLTVKARCGSQPADGSSG